MSRGAENLFFEHMANQYPDSARSDQQKIQEQLKSACIAAVKSYQSALDGLIKSHHVVVSSSYDDVVPGMERNQLCFAD